QQLGGYNNIIWFLGGDLNPPDQANVLDVTRAEANAIRSNEPVHHLISYHATGDNGIPHSSSEWLNNESWLDFNMIQGRDKLTDPDCLSAAVYTDYNRTPTRPTLLAETEYEVAGYPDTSPYNVRRNEYQGLLAGALGVNYGNSPVEAMVVNDSSWKNHL